MFHLGCESRQSSEISLNSDLNFRVRISQWWLEGSVLRSLIAYSFARCRNMIAIRYHLHTFHWSNFFINAMSHQWSMNQNTKEGIAPSGCQFFKKWCCHARKKHRCQFDQQNSLHRSIRIYFQSDNATLTISSSLSWDCHARKSENLHLHTVSLCILKFLHPNQLWVYRKDLCKNMSLLYCRQWNL